MPLLPNFPCTNIKKERPKHRAHSKTLKETSLQLINFLIQHGNSHKEGNNA